MSNYKSWKLPASFITTTELADGTIVAADIADGTVSTSKFAATVAPTISGGTINNATIGATTPSSGVFNELSVTKTGDLSVEIGGSNSAQIDLKSPSSDDFDFRLRTAGTGAELDSGSGYTFKSAGVTKLQIDNSGNLVADGSIHAKTWSTVGIGSLAPEVVINGGTGSAEGAQIRFQKASTDAAWIGIESTIIGGTGDSLLLKSKSGQAINFYPSGSYAGQFSSGGNFVANGSITGASLNIGAGVASFGTLTTGNTGKLVINISPADAAGYEDIVFRGATNNNLAMIRGNTTGGTNGTLYLGAQGAFQAAITSAGLSVTGTLSASGITTCTQFDVTTGNGIYTAGTNTVGFQTAGVNRMTIDSSGNLTLGTGAASSISQLILSGGSDTNKGSYLHIKKAGTTVGYFGDTGVLEGNTSSDIGTYVTTGRGQRWYVNGSATASMTLDSSGNLSVSGEKFNLGGTSNNAVINTIASMYFNIDSDNNGTEVFGWGHNGNTTVADRLMTLDSGGRLGVGLQTPYAGTRVDTIVPTDANQWAFGARSFDAGTGNGTTTVNVLRVVNSSNGNWANAKYHAYSHNWGIGGTASNNSSMTLSANGDLSIGADAPPAGANRLYVQSTSTYATSFWQTDTSFAGIVSSIGCAAPAGTGFTLLQCMSGAPYTSSVAQFKVRGDGVLFAQNTAVQSLSDRSIKENIRDLEIGLSTINMLRPRRFDFIEGWGANKKNALGFIAQEVQEVLPELVTSEKFIDNSDAEHLTLGTTDLIPVLVKAIQELTAKNTALEARLSAAGL